MFSGYIAANGWRYVAGRLAWHVFSFKGQVKKNFNAMYTCWLALLKDFGICQVVLNLFVISPRVSRPGWRGSVVGVAACRKMIDTATARTGFVRRPIKSLCIGQFEKN